MKILKLIWALLLATALAGCSTPPAYYSIGGTVSGLNGTVVLTLDNYGTQDLSVSSNGSFTFKDSVESGKNSTVSVKTQPANQLCTVSNGDITNFTANRTDVIVNCETQNWRVTTGTENLIDLLHVNWQENPTSVLLQTKPFLLYFWKASSLIVSNNFTSNETFLYIMNTSDSSHRGSAIDDKDAVSTIVGNTLYSAKNGAIYTGSTVFSNANLNSPKGMVADASGNLYVADSGNHVIKKIDTSGNMTVFAGSLNNAGDVDGQGTAATFNYPWGLAIDSNGNLYVANNWSHTIRKISPSGLVSTLAGKAGLFGSDDGTGEAARFLYPKGVATDASGNVYVADTNNNLIRKISPYGVVTTLAGRAGRGYVDGALADAKFDAPTGIAVDSDGTIYVGDYANNALRRIKNEH